MDNPVVAALIEDILSEIGELVARHFEIVLALVTPLDGARVDAINGPAVLAIAAAMIAAFDVVSEAPEIGDAVLDVLLLGLVNVFIEAAEDLLQGKLDHCKLIDRLWREACTSRLFSAFVSLV